MVQEDLHLHVQASLAYISINNITTELQILTLLYARVLLKYCTCI